MTDPITPAEIESFETRVMSVGHGVLSDSEWRRLVDTLTAAQTERDMFRDALVERDAELTKIVKDVRKERDDLAYERDEWHRRATSVNRKLYDTEDQRDEAITQRDKFVRLESDQRGYVHQWVNRAYAAEAERDALQRRVEAMQVVVEAACGFMDEFSKSRDWPDSVPPLRKAITTYRTQQEANDE